MNEQRPNQPTSSESTDSDAQISQGPSGAPDTEALGGADAVPDTPDRNFGEDTARTRPERRGSTLPADE